MLKSCVSWPVEDAERYRNLGYWIDEELSQILERQVQENPTQIAVIDNDIEKSYACLEKEATRLASYMAAQGLCAGDTAIVQLPNCYEFYVVFFALQKLAVLPVNALMNHNQVELTHYAAALQPKLIIADAKHSLFGDSQFFEQLQACTPQLQHVLLRGQSTWAKELGEKLHASACFEHFDSLPFRKHQADNVAFFQLSGEAQVHLS
ncbi:AMP-binding protein [Pseudoalteromonas piscicida]|uniref:AMP-binding protein n=1 Tax=Pseudoalteromonas piscicida TaxID=43662 RepID=UPI0022B277CC|nr:AMP-binding protein [Pseudoalteromonas piscicida]